MPKNPHADFTPTLAGYSGITPFRFWCQTALPLTYDDSLSYYELLNKVVNYLNHTIEDLTNVENNTSELAEAYDKLQKYVNDYFDDIDIEAELRNVLDGMVEDGTLDALLDPLVANRLPDVVGEQIDDVVAEQIDNVVGEQIDDVVGEQLPPLVDAGIGEEVTQWLENNVDPVGSAVLVDNTLSISGAAADAKATGDAVGELKTQLNTITNNSKITFTRNYYIATNGDTANISTRTYNASYEYAVVDCNPGEVFTVSGTGGSTPKLWAFLGAEENGVRPVLEREEKAQQRNDLFIIAPANSEKLVLNANVNYTPRYAFTGKIVKAAFREIDKTNADANYIKHQITEVSASYQPFDVVLNEYVKKTDGTFATEQGAFRTDYIEIPDNINALLIDIPVASTYSAWYASDKTFISAMSELTDAGIKKLTIPSNAKYYIISGQQANLANYHLYGKQKMTEIINSLLNDYVNNTTQTVTLNQDGKPTQIEHKRGNETIRTDNFQYSGNTITEERTDATTGYVVTIISNIATLSTEVL